MDALQDAYAVLYQDHPEIFWASSINYYWGVFKQNNDGSWRDTDLEDPADAYKKGETCKAYVWVKFDLTTPWNGVREIDADESLVSNKISSIVDQVDVSASRYRQLLQIHDWLTKNNSYNSAAANGDTSHGNIPWEAFSAFASDQNPVCSGYAKAFKMLCDALDIPCVLIGGTGVSNTSSENHLWNYVKMEDEKWYAVDVTWDDQVNSSIGSEIDRENRDYFLVGSSTNVEGRAFSDSHVTGTINRPSGGYFDLPPLSPTAYTYSATVTFDSRGDQKFDKEVLPQKILIGDQVTEPRDPEKEGYTFEGWYKDMSCLELYDFASPVTEDLTLYARWREKMIIITKQPADFCSPQDVLTAHNKAGFSIEAESVNNEKLTYQWQVSEGDEKPWKDLKYSTVGFNTEAIEIVFISKIYGEFRLSL